MGCRGCNAGDPYGATPPASACIPDGGPRLQREEVKATMRERGTGVHTGLIKSIPIAETQQKLPNARYVPRLERGEGGVAHSGPAPALTSAGRHSDVGSRGARFGINQGTDLVFCRCSAHG